MLPDCFSEGGLMLELILFEYEEFEVFRDVTEVDRDREEAFELER